jgi:hypothetical protein
MGQLFSLHLLCVWSYALILAISYAPLIFLDIDRWNSHSRAEGCPVVKKRLPMAAEGSEADTGYFPPWPGMPSWDSPPPGFPPGLRASSGLFYRSALLFMRPNNPSLNLIAPSNQPGGHPNRQSV